MRMYSRDLFISHTPASANRRDAGTGRAWFRCLRSLSTWTKRDREFVQACSPEIHETDIGKIPDSLACVKGCEGRFKNLPGTCKLSGIARKECSKTRI